MPFAKQKAAENRLLLEIQFPELPRFPQMTISADREAMAGHEREMQAWYRSHRTAVSEAFAGLVSEVEKLKQRSG